jgi:hypothetical protein
MNTALPVFAHANEEGANVSHLITVRLFSFPILFSKTMAISDTTLPPQPDQSLKPGPRFCPKCGTQLTGGAFCGNCGNNIEAKDRTETGPEAKGLEGKSTRRKGSKKNTFIVAAAVIIIVIVLLSTSFFGALNSQNTNAPNANDFQYSLINNGAAVEITGYIGPGGDVTIPSTIDGKPVTSIGGSIYSSNNSFSIDYLTSIVIPDTVTNIGPYAFALCFDLRSVTIPDSVTNIGVNAFESCWSLVSVNIPHGVTIINDGTFDDCRALTSVNIPNSVTAIGSDAFYGCALTAVNIPDSVTTIALGAFDKCNMTSVTIPGSVTNMSYPFQYCSDLTKITFMGNAPSLYYFEGYDFDINPSLTIYYKQNATGFTTPSWEGLPCYPLS